MKLVLSISVLNNAFAELVWSSNDGPMMAKPIYYPGGWADDAKTQCVDICINSNPKPTCFTNSTDCIHKHQKPGDYDTLLFDQLFQPQFCRDLLRGVDPTLTHRPVAPFPIGIQCKNKIDSKLLIHGLWPNYDGGFPACCNTSSHVLNHPFDPKLLQEKYPTLLSSMAYVWRDATQEIPYDMMCELWNHEFQKHGLCYISASGSYEAAAAQYLTDTIEVSNRLINATKAIEMAAMQAQAILSTRSIQNLYQKKVMVLCVYQHEVYYLSGIRSCWSKPVSTIHTSVQIDCKDKDPTHCPNDTMLSLAPYQGK
nr:secreted protein [Thraustotheca clavata]